MTDTARSASDIPAGSWIDRRVPRPARPYLRLMRADRPIGTWLLLLPCWWGAALGAAARPGGGWPDLAAMLLFAVGAFVMRGAGCTWNDMLDRDVDRRVARTADRPIASGQVGMKQAAAFLALQLAIGLGVLLQFNAFTIWMGFAAMPLVLAYPLMKRVTYWPQAWLGLTFNWGALLGWTAATGGLDWPVLALYGAGIAWTLGYDTIYAHQDKADDLIVGVKSLALKFGAGTKPWLWAFYALTVAALAAAGILAGLSWPFFALLALAAIQLAWQMVDVDIDDPTDCLTKFRSNRWFGLVVTAAIVAGAVAA